MSISLLAGHVLVENVSNATATKIIEIITSGLNLNVVDRSVVRAERKKMDTGRIIITSFVKMSTVMDTTRTFVCTAMRILSLMKKGRG